MSFVDILTAFGKGSIAVIGTIGSSIAKGSLSKIGANITETVSSKFVPSQDTDDLDDENRFYCPFCGTAIKHGREVCLGCKADVIYGKTKEESKGEALITLIFGGIVAFIVLVMIPKWLNYVLNWNITSRFGLGVFSSLYSGLFIAFGISILLVVRQKSIESKQRIRCRRYGFSKEDYKDRDIEY